jgi:hypothetical protein
MHALRRFSALFPAFLALAILGLAASAHAQTTRVRAIVLSFEGWNADQARDAVATGMNAAYDVISEQQAVDTAMQMGVDPGTPEGLGAVVQRLHIQLVVGGSVSGRGARAQTTIWVTDTNGNQLATATAGSPSGRGYQGELAAAALQACGTAVAALPPQTTTGRGTGTGTTTGTGTGTGDTGTGTTEPNPEEGGTATPAPEPDYDTSYDIENEVAGRPRGQRDGERRSSGGGGGGGGSANPDRWNQPVFRGLIGVDIRNLSASTASVQNLLSSHQSGYAADFAPVLGLWLETRPWAQQDDAARGLYAYFHGEVSVGLQYRVPRTDLPDGSARNFDEYGFDLGVGYAGTVAEVVELIGTVGFGYEGLTLHDALYTPSAACSGTRPPANCAGGLDFPGYQIYTLRPAIGARVRLVQDLLILSGTFGGRIAVGWGDLTLSDYGGPGGGGFDFSLGLEGIIDPGFSWLARFGYQGNYVTFTDPGTNALPGDFTDSNGFPWTRDSGVIESWRILLGVGWAFR